MMRNKIVVVCILLLFMIGCKNVGSSSTEVLQNQIDQEVMLDEAIDPNKEQGIGPSVANYNSVVLNYEPVEDNNLNERKVYTHRIDEIHNLDVLNFDMPWDSGFKTTAIPFDMIKEKIGGNKEYFYGAEKGPDSFYLFEGNKDNSSVDIYRVNYELPYRTDNYSLVLEENIELDITIEEMMTTVNSIVFFYYTVDHQYMMRITDRDLVIIQEFIMPEGIKVERMEIILAKNTYYYLLEIELDHEANKVLLPLDYSGYEGVHFVDQFWSSPILNGEIYGNQFFYFASNNDMEYSIYENDLIISSNKGAVLTLNTLPKMMIQRTRYLNDYFIVFDINELPAYVSKYNVPISEDHPLYSLPIYKDNIRADQYGNSYYIEKDTYALVQIDKNFKEINRVTIEDEDILNCITKEQHNDFWIVQEGYLLADDDENWFYYMNLQNSEVGKIPLDGKYVEYGNYQANIYDSGQTTFNVITESFINNYSTQVNQSAPYRVSYFEYEGIAYYEDNPEFSYSASDMINEREDILPESMAPSFEYDGHQVSVINSKTYEGSQYFRLMDNGWVGSITEEVFEPIVKEDVRNFIMTEFGIVYLEYDKRANIITMKTESIKTQLEENLPIDSIAVSDQFLYYIVDSSILKRIKLSDMAIESVSPLIAEELHDLALLAGETPMDTYGDKYKFFLEGNDDYVVAFDANNYKTLVFDKEKQLVEQMNTSFIHLTEDNQIIMEVLSFFTRHDIESGKDAILGEYYFVSKNMVFKDYLITCTPYEGPGHTQAIDMTGEEVNLFEQYDNYSDNLDYSIEIGNSHQAYIIVYDHKLKKLSLYDVIWSKPNYELTEEGLRYWVERDDYKDGGLIPLREGAKVQVYATKRT